jgi:hypothetical protein
VQLIIVLFLAADALAAIGFEDHFIENRIRIAHLREGDDQITDAEAARDDVVRPADAMQQLRSAAGCLMGEVRHRSAGQVSSDIMCRKVLGILILLSLAALLGCENKLETGYAPKPLNASSTVRRGFYASPFTPEARAAELEREQELEARRPRPGY